MHPSHYSYSVWVLCGTSDENMHYVPADVW